MLKTLDLPELREIRRRIAPFIHETPLLRSETLSRMSGHNVHLKAELFQKTGSYKPRGMLWSLLSMAPEQRERGVITFSAGNAAQGLAGFHLFRRRCSGSIALNSFSSALVARSDRYATAWR